MLAHSSGEIKMMFVAIVRATKQRRAITIAEFEWRHVAAPRVELDEVYEDRCNGILGKI